MSVLLTYPFTEFEISTMLGREVTTHCSDGEHYDLVVFPGGSDINPSRYGEENIASNYDNDRDNVEFGILKKILIGEIVARKILGICRGLQLFHVFRGGCLIQHIEPRHPMFHTIEWKTRNVFDDMTEVNSLHHQGLVLPSRGLKVLATEPTTGIVEAAYSKVSTSSGTIEFLGFQFHPEMMSSNEKFGDVVNSWVENRVSVLL